MRWWQVMAQRLGAPELMERMFARFGVGDSFAGRDPHQAAEMLRGATLRCMSCGSAQERGV